MHTNKHTHINKVCNIVALNLTALNSKLHHAHMNGTSGWDLSGMPYGVLSCCLVWAAGAPCTRCVGLTSEQKKNNAVIMHKVRRADQRAKKERTAMNLHKVRRASEEKEKSRGSP